jgi:DNA polymerase elongation subunit (family B)
VKFYLNSKQYGNNVLVRGIENGERFIEKFPFQPTLYSRVNRETGFKSLEGEHLLPKVFDDINGARDFVKKYRDVDNFPIFGNTAFQFQWIADNYKGEIEYDLDQIKVMSIDIETTVNYGFPDYFDPKEEITLITCRDKVTKAITTFGCWEYTPKKKGATYVQCRDEVDLLCKFINWFNRDHPDIITGWNTDGFDIPYLVCRCRKVVGEEITKKLSPFGIIKHRDVEVMGKMIQEYDIYGIASLDYLALFRKFAFLKFENEKLDTVAYEVLGRNKVENPYSSFKEFYQKDPELFTDYNIVDVELVDELEGELKLIELAISIAYMAKINFDDVYSPVKMWDTIIYNHLLDQGIVVPFKQDTFEKSIEGAFVKDVQVGKHGWLASFDLASLYPHIIMALNMSPETIVNRMIDVSVEELLGGDRSKVLPGYSLAPNGSMYDMSKTGFLPVLMSKYYNGRKEVKDEMLDLKKQLEANRHSMTAEEIRKMEAKITAKKNMQQALKIAINSAYGALAQKSFRFFDTRIAEGITMSGQLIIRTAEKTINSFMNNMLKPEKPVDYVIASDTDSLYVALSQFVNAVAPGKTQDETVEFLCKVCDGKLSNILNDGCDDLATTMNWNLGKIVFKREAIASTGIWVGKKMYALIVHDNERVRYEKPDLKVMGLALVRSSTPNIVKEPLRKCIEVILTGDEGTLQQYVQEVEAMYMKQPHDVIAFPRGVNNLAKYRSNSTIYVKAHCPIQVRSSLLYNHLLKENGMADREPIQEGGKMKFVYLKEPNTLHENVIGFTDKIPTEFNLIRYVDYQTMFDKSFIEPLKKLTQPIGWSHKEVATLEGLFE